MEKTTYTCMYVSKYMNMYVELQIPSPRFVQQSSQTCTTFYMEQHGNSICASQESNLGPNDGNIGFYH
eukprot:5712653-Ditylum_brightwellii.AAC.1